MMLSTLHWMSVKEVSEHGKDNGEAYHANL